MGERMNMKNILPIFFVLFVLFAPASASAQELAQDQVTISKARVLSITSEETEVLPGLDISATNQALRAVILDGVDEGKTVDVENHSFALEEGEVFYIMHTVSAFDGRDGYTVYEFDRMPVLYVLLALFVGVIVLFGGKQGVRGLVALSVSLLSIFFVLLPLIHAGYSPILVSIGIAAIIVVFGSYITHGFNHTTTSAVFGMLLTISLTGVLAYMAIHFGRLSGFETDEAVFLNYNTRGALDFAGLLFGGIMIGILGILYDVSIGQSAAVEELHKTDPKLSRRSVYLKALRIGREHTGALVNTLAIAYVGVSLPLLLLFYSSSTTDFITIVNREIFATEIIRTMVGSIGLVLAVPITTLIATLMVIKAHKAKE